MKKIIDSFFIAVVLLVLSMFIVSIFREPKELSSLENRTLNKYPYFKISDFLSGKYQDDLEDGLADQLLGSGTIKLIYNEVKGVGISNNLNLLKTISPQLCSNYLSVGKGFFTFNCEDFLVRKPKEFDQFKILVDEFVSDYSQGLNMDETFFYFINTYLTLDFLEDLKTNKYYDYLKFKLKNVSQLEIDSYEKYKNYFYKTDHHWNHEGSYQGYKDIINLVAKKDDQLLTPIKVEEYPFNFIGSSGRSLVYFKSYDPFTVYEFNFPKMQTLINGVENQYGRQENYFSGNYKTDRFLNHYGLFYGWDFGEVVYNTNNPKKENLLVISSSFSNAINNLLASHFNKTHVIDIRHYEKYKGETFQPRKYIKENKIDKVLVVMDLGLIQSNEFKLFKEI